MKIVVFNDWRIGVIDANRVFDVTSVLPKELALLPMQRMNWLIDNWKVTEEGVRAEQARTVGVPLSSVRLRAVNPAALHVFAAPANYRKHIGELGDRAVSKGGRSAREQGFFLKASSSLSGLTEGVMLPRGSARRFDHESELAVIIGRHGRNIRREDAMQYVFGYACLVDLTMRIEPGTGEEERSMRKSFETFTPVGPWIVTADEVADPHALSNRLWINGELRQEANTADMIVGVAELIELISSVLPITPGDIIACGTPEGVGPVTPGDVLKIAIDGVGEMILQIREQDVRSPRAY